MNKLLKANFVRLKKNAVFWGGIAFLIGYNVIVCVSQYRVVQKYNMDNSPDITTFNHMVLLGIVVAVFCSLYIGTEFSDGVIRNKIMTGRSRSCIYLSNFVTCAATATIMYGIAVVTAGAMGLVLFGPFEMSMGSLLQRLLIGFLSCIAYGALFNLIAMLNLSKAHSAVISLLVAFGMLFLATFLVSGLSQPEMIERAAGNTLEEMKMEIVANPNYLTGVKREVYQFILDVLPAGQSVQIASTEIAHPMRLVPFSIVVAIISNVAGLFVFRKKDIK